MTKISQKRDKLISSVDPFSLKFTVKIRKKVKYSIPFGKGNSAEIVRAGLEQDRARLEGSSGKRCRAHRLICFF